MESIKQEFVAFYQTIFYLVMKETITYDESKITPYEIEAVVTAVSKAFASRVHINEKVCALTVSCDVTNASISMLLLFHIYLCLELYEVHCILDA